MAIQVTELATPIPTQIRIWHQKDHTLQYRRGSSFPSTPITTPTPSSMGDVAPNAPTSVPDIGIVFANSLDIAVKELNKVFGGAPGLFFCEEGDCSPQDGRVVRNDVITIQLFKDHENRCGNRVAWACVSRDAFRLRPHVGTGYMYIENPVISHDAKGKIKARYFWTDVWGGKVRAGKCMEEKDTGHTICPLYLPSVIMHEFGHAAGIYEINVRDAIENDPHHLESNQGIMSPMPKGKVFLQADIEVMLKQYNNPFHRPH